MYSFPEFLSSLIRFLPFFGVGVCLSPKLEEDVDKFKFLVYVVEVADIHRYYHPAKSPYQQNARSRNWEEYFLFLK